MNERMRGLWNILRAKLGSDLIQSLGFNHPPLEMILRSKSLLRKGLLDEFGMMKIRAK